MDRPKIRLFVHHPLGPGNAVPLTQAQAHYLGGVMRLGAGDAVALFDGAAGEWAARIERLGKRGGTAVCMAQTAPQRDPPDLWLLFAPIKKTRTDFIVEKAAELGVRRILPVATERTNAERVRTDRLQAHAVEAAEQCGGTFVPEVADLAPLPRVLDSWDARALIFCDEALAGAACQPVPQGAETEGKAIARASAPDRALSAADDARRIRVPGHPAADVWRTVPGPPAAVLIGPEGGFSPTERQRLGAVATAVSLGPRILRADTAAVAALTLWQAARGDWG